MKAERRRAAERRAKPGSCVESCGGALVEDLLVGVSGCLAYASDAAASTTPAKRRMTERILRGGYERLPTRRPTSIVETGPAERRMMCKGTLMW